MSDTHKIHDRAIIRARALATPLGRLHDLAPRLLRLVPTTIDEAAERLAATRAEVEDAVSFAEDHIAVRHGRLMAREGPRESAWAVADIYTR